MEFTIEQINREELGRAKPLLLALHQHEVVVQPALNTAPARDMEGFWNFYAANFPAWWDEGGFAFLAIDEDDRPIGFVFGAERGGHPGYENGERVGYIEDIAVLEDLRGVGVGRALMDAARGVFRDRGFSYFQLSSVPGNEDARAFYRRLGMEPSAVLMLGEV